VCGRHALWLLINTTDVDDADAIGSAGHTRKWWWRWGRRRWWWGTQMLELSQDGRCSILLFDDDHLSLIAHTVDTAPDRRRTVALVVGRRQNLWR
jgi:hypothetical protein